LTIFGLLPSASKLTVLLAVSVMRKSMRFVNGYFTEIIKPHCWPGQLAGNFLANRMEHPKTNGFSNCRWKAGEIYDKTGKTLANPRQYCILFSCPQWQLMPANAGQ
jgi:hypothetical protein